MITVDRKWTDSMLVDVQRQYGTEAVIPCVYWNVINWLFKDSDDRLVHILDDTNIYIIYT